MLALVEGMLSSASMRLTVRSGTPVSSLSRWTDQRKAKRAILSWFPVTIDYNQNVNIAPYMALNIDTDINWRSEFQRHEGAYAPSTMRSYRSDVEAFEAWC